jgi:hypothetical protein
MPVPVPSELTPIGEQKYALLSDQFLRGGFRVVETEADLKTIEQPLPPASRSEHWNLAAITRDEKNGSIIPRQ